MSYLFKKQRALRQKKKERQNKAANNNSFQSGAQQFKNQVVPQASSCQDAPKLRRVQLRGWTQ